MRKLTITFHTDKCVGAFKCTNIAPAFFAVHGEKAELLQGTHSHDGKTTSRTVECTDAVAEQILSAAKHCPTNVISIVDATTNKTVVDTAVIVTQTVREIQAQYDDDKEFVLDEKGYFLIRIVPEHKLIEVGFCGKRNTVEVKVTGKKPIDIYQTILREHIITRPDHAAYLGRELQKAFIALQLGLAYVQDDELVFKK